MSRGSGIFTCLLVLLLPMVASSQARAADYWASPGDPVVVTNNDCGYISNVGGSPVIRRSFHTQNHPGVPAHVADRINSGDELIVPTGSRLEWTSGSNMVVTLGSGARAKLGGLRQFPDPGGVMISRLDLTLAAGEMRVQVRLNEEKPEMVMAILAGAEVLVRRGDVEMFSDSVWRGAVLAGDAFARVRRGGVAGAPFTIAARQGVGANGEETLSDRDVEDIMKRLPFSFEITGAALPPLPPMSSNLEAP